MSSFLTLKTVGDVYSIIDALHPVEAESVPLTGCPGRTLACDHIAQENLPGFPRSTMDGYAVRARDVFGATEGSPALLDMVGECPMGCAPDITITPGKTARIWTGGMLPQGADAVVMLEYSRPVGTSQVELTRPVAPLDNTLAKDEDVVCGDAVFPAGWVLYPQDLGLLASLGQETVSVRRKPKFAIISSGDEIVPTGSKPAPGQIRESNSHTLCALVEAAGGEATSLGIVPDSMEALTASLQKGLEFADAVIITGGSSAGQRDFTCPAFAALPGWEVLVHGIAIKPGKPTIVARNGNKTLWGLPGNPTAAFITSEIFIRRLIRSLLGQPKDQPPQSTIMARLSRRVSSAQGRRDYIRVILQPGNENEAFPVALPLLGPSGLVSNPSRADGLVVCPETLEGLNADDIVQVHLLRL